MSDDSLSESVIDFWFGIEPQNEADIERCRRRWFFADDALDAQISAEFGNLARRAAAGELDQWAETARGRLALIILLDQFPRNLYRGTSRAFATDQHALELTLDGLEKRMHTELSPLEQVFFCMPLQHVESSDAQNLSVEVFSAMCERRVSPLIDGALEQFADFAREHRDIIVKFGRFPHRNATLGRESTPEEVAFLTDGGPTFGQ